MTASLREIWTHMNTMDESTLPPLNKPVMLAEKGSERRQWFIFRTVKARRFTCTTSSFTHWRGELMVDFP